jgi:methyl-accepting chemotaxis protein
MLNRSEFAEHGEVLLVDRQGSIQMRTDYSRSQAENSFTPELSSTEQPVAKTKTLQAIVGEDIAKLALTPQAEPLTPFIGIKNHMLGSSYIPSMNWFVVVYVPKSAFVMTASD